MSDNCHEIVLSSGRSYRCFLEAVKSLLDQWQLHELNSVQAMVIYNIGRDEMTVGELTARGYYLGSNVSYNVRELADSGYLEQNRSPHDRRSVRVKLSAKGLAVHDRLEKMFDSYGKGIAAAGITAEDLALANKTLHRLERFWNAATNGHVDY